LTYATTPILTTNGKMDEYGAFCALELIFFVELGAIFQLLKKMEFYPLTL